MWSRGTGSNGCSSLQGTVTLPLYNKVETLNTFQLERNISVITRRGKKKERETDRDKEKDRQTETERKRARHRQRQSEKGKRDRQTAKVSPLVPREYLFPEQGYIFIKVAKLRVHLS